MTTAHQLGRCANTLRDAENVIRTCYQEFRLKRREGEDVPTALLLLCLPFLRVAQLARLSCRTRNDLGIEIVMLRHEVAVL